MGNGSVFLRPQVNWNWWIGWLRNSSVHQLGNKVCHHDSDKGLEIFFQIGRCGVVSVLCVRSQLHWLVGANPWSKTHPKGHTAARFECQVAFPCWATRCTMADDTWHRWPTKIQLQILQEKSIFSPKKSCIKLAPSTFKTFQTFQASPLNPKLHTNSLRWMPLWICHLWLTHQQTQQFGCSNGRHPQNEKRVSFFNESGWYQSYPAAEGL